MGILDPIFGAVVSEDRDMAAIASAWKKYRAYKERKAKADAEISEAERKEAEEALSFLRLNNEDVS